MHILAAPFEIILEVFSRLDRENLSHCARICKSLNEVALNNTFIKTCVLNSIDVQLFVQLLEYMPNIQFLNLRASHWKTYAMYLISSESTDYMNHIQAIRLLEITEIGMQNVLNFVKRLSSIKSCILYLRNYNANGPSCLRQEFIVYGIKYGRKTSIQNHGPFECRLDRCDYYRQAEDGQRVIELALPDINSSIFLTKAINELTFQIDENNSRLTMVFLKYALLNYPNLYQCEVEIMTTPDPQLSEICTYQSPQQQYQPTIRKNQSVLIIRDFIPSESMLEEIVFYAPHVIHYDLRDPSTSQSGE
ncbi:uncharacterized protein EV154DRAFT_577184 [Mucor mucedo]|uniref:uncharacterized protein n=1 Tax=Mucor mucedo TaxID=29922 RepID=UPI00221FD0CA|nr:uncharacterized protein EV154DRAFT_577184 [Mucor mucedo]KAI7876492.1 hypothetical protein EV154DRAFT_577184 [Mucor mucedo]